MSNQQSPQQQLHPRLGIDAVEIARVARLLQKNETQWLRRCLSEKERAWYLRQTWSAKRAAEWAAGRFAAKEAVLKALGTGLAQGLRFDEIEILSDPAGHPQVRLTGQADQRFKQGGGQHVALSITHEAGLALAAALLITYPKPVSNQTEVAMNYPLVEGNIGYHLSCEDLTHCPAFLSPTGIRRMARKADRIIYEVIRVVEGRPIFWVKHLERLEASARAVGLTPPGRETWFEVAKRLYETEPRAEANLRLVLTEDCIWAHYSQTYYPTLEQQTQGVPTAILDWERVDPQIKRIHADYKAAVATKMGQPTPAGPAFEVLLRNHRGQLTEGSRSNLFFVRNAVVYSAPAAEILLGITREVVLKALEQVGMTLCEALPSWEKVAQEGEWAAFISASPIDLLPVSHIEGVELKAPEKTRIPDLMKAYHDLLHEQAKAYDFGACHG